MPFDPFATLGIARAFEVDLAATEKRHRELSRALHPDKYAAAAPSERRDALSKAASVNEAWRVVRDPVSRAEALFALAGVAVGERNEPKPTQALLMEALERREALDEAKAKRDIAAIDRLVGEVDASRRAAEDRLRAGFAESAGRARGHGDLQALVPVLGELRFHRRFLDEVSAIEDAMAESELAARSST